MNCAESEEQILECFDGEQRPPAEPVATHIAECTSCAQFYAAQSDLHRVLTDRLSPPILSPEFQATVLAKVKRERSRQVWNMVPDLVHFGGGLITTIACALFIPQTAGTVVGIGVAFTLLSYVVSIFVGSWLEDDVL
jgi:predicted anti-sigma-YlaC factor YlaD